MSLTSYAHVAATPVPRAVLTVRPDQARFALTASVDVDSAAAALPHLRRALQRLEDLLPPLHARLEVTDFDLQPAGKLEAAPLAKVQATLVVPLAADAGFWERAARVAQVDDLLRAVVTEGKRQKPSVELRRHAPVFVVGAPEQHRAALVALALDRARALPGAVTLSGLRFERPVEQHSVGLEAVELTLGLEGLAACTP